MLIATTHTSKHPEVQLMKCFAQRSMTRAVIRPANCDTAPVALFTA